MADNNYVTEESLRATGITMMVLGSVAAAIRLLPAILRPKTFQWEDGWLVGAYLIFMAIAILYQVVSPPMFRIEQVSKGKAEPYATIGDDGLFLQKIFFVVTSGLW
jgi:hypothetical protein